MKRRQGLNRLQYGIDAYRTGKQAGKALKHDTDGEADENALEQVSDGAKKTFKTVRELAGQSNKSIKTLRGVIQEKTAKKAANKREKGNRNVKNTGDNSDAAQRSKTMIKSNERAKSLKSKMAASERGTRGRSRVTKSESKRYSAGAGNRTGPAALKSKAKKQEAAATLKRAQNAVKQKMIAKKAAKATVKTTVKATAKVAAKTAATATKTAALTSNPIGWIILIIIVVVLIVVLIVFAMQFAAMGVSAVEGQRETMGYGGSFVFPLHNHDTHNCEFTDTFGADRDGGKRGHSGIDIGASQGDPIYSPVNGTVVTNRWNGTANPGGTGGGWEISVRDDKGYTYKMLHMMKQSTVPVGTEVIAGVTILGYVGHTGNNITVDHLHISMQDENGNYFSGYQILRQTHDNPWNDPTGNLPSEGNTPAVLNSVVSKPSGVDAPIATLTGYRITYYSGGEGETVDRYGNKLVIGTAAKWMGLGNNAYPAGMPDGTIFSIGEGTNERFYKITDVGSFGNQPKAVKEKTFDLFAGDNVPASELTSSKYGTQTGVTIKIWKWGNS